MTQIKHTRLASRAVARAVNAFAHSLVLAETDRIWRIDIGTPDFCALDKTVSSANISPLSQGNLTEKKQNTNTNYSKPSWIQRIDDVVCIVIENYFGILHFLVILFVVLVTLNLVIVQKVQVTKLQ